MKEWHLILDENGGEYTGILKVFAEELKRLDDCTIVADGIKIKWEERILEIAEIK